MTSTRKRPPTADQIDALLAARRPDTDTEHPMVPGFGHLAGGPPADECLHTDGEHAPTEPGHDLCAACEAALAAARGRGDLDPTDPDEAAELWAEQRDRGSW